MPSRRPELLRVRRSFNARAMTHVPTWLGCALLVCGGFMLLPASVTQSTPFNYGAGVKPSRWPENKTISIYIEADPDPNAPDTSELLKEGMSRWSAQMAPRGITINVAVGEPPNPPPTNVVRCRYKAVGSKLTGDDPNDPNYPALSDENHGLAGCNNAGGTITTAEIIIRNDIWSIASGSDEQKKEYIRNLGQHEVTHVLGLADDSAGTVTNHTQTTTPNTYNDQDKKEIGTLYPTLPQNPPKAGGQGQQQNQNNYQYNFNYQGGPEDHVPLIALDIRPEVIAQVLTPPGWVVLNPADPAHHNSNHPFYQNYMEDGHSFPAPWDGSVTPALTLRAADPAAALSVNNPVVGFMVIAQNAVPGQVDAWAGDDVQSLLGPVPAGPAIPASTPAWQVITALTLIAAGGLVLWRRVS